MRVECVHILIFALFREEKQSMGRQDEKTGTQLKCEQRGGQQAVTFRAVGNPSINYSQPHTPIRTHSSSGHTILQPGTQQTADHVLQYLLLKKNLCISGPSPVQTRVVQGPTALSLQFVFIRFFGINWMSRTFERETLSM